MSDIRKIESEDTTILRELDDMEYIHYMDVEDSELDKILTELNKR